MQTQEPIQLTLEDIANMLRLIEIASTRGAFNLEEYIDVGNCYTRITKFLRESATQQQVSPPSEIASESTN